MRICYHFLTLRWCEQCISSLWQTEARLTKLIQYRGCWWPGDASSTVASFIKEINQRLAKRPLKTNGGLANVLSKRGHRELAAIILILIYVMRHYTLLAKKVVTPPLKTIKPMWIELLCFHLPEIGMIWTRGCSPMKSDTTLGRHSMQGQVGSSSSETTV